MGETSQKAEWVAPEVCCPTYEEVVEDLAESQKRTRQRLESIRPCLPIAKGYAQRWVSRKGRSAVISPVGFDRTVAYCYLSDNDNIRDDALRLMADALDDSRLTLVSERILVEHGWKEWNFRELGGGEISFLFLYGKSKKCHLVPTGEKKDVMELVCD